MALPIGHGQSISPPFVVAYMTEQLDPQPSDRVLEIGTGSGYQAAVLSHLVRRCVHDRDSRTTRPARRRGAERVGLRKRASSHRRWLPRLARGGTVRQDHRHLLARKGAAATRRSTSRRRTPDRAGGREVPAKSISLSKDERQVGRPGPGADDVRSDDGCGRTAASSAARWYESRTRWRQL